MKKFLGKDVLTMAAGGGLLHGGVHQTEKNFFQRRAGRGDGWAETLSLQGYMVRRRKEGRSRKAAACWGGQIVVAKQMKLC